MLAASLVIVGLYIGSAVTVAWMRRPKYSISTEFPKDAGRYGAAANPHLEDVLIRYDNLATRIWCMVLDRLPDLSRHIHEHLDLLRAVIDGDEAGAANLARIHVSGFEHAVREALFAA